MAGLLKRAAAKKHKSNPLSDSTLRGRGLKLQPMYSRANRSKREIPLLLVYCEDLAVAFLNNISVTGVSSCSPVTDPKCAKDASGPKVQDCFNSKQ